MSEIDRVVQQPDVGARIELFDLDMTSLGGDVLHFTASGTRQVSTANPQGFIRWRGEAYTPMPVQATGFEVNGRGALPRPRLKVANINRVFSSLIIEFNDGLGAKLTRWRTFEKFLDDGDEPDQDAHFPVDVYVIERKSAQNKVFVEWELSAAMDQEGRMLPGRQVIRDYCDHTYRRWDGAAFDYTNATCPYVGDSFFTSAGVATPEPSLDRCSKQLVTGCRKRFGQSPLPTGAFPGVARVRI